jgi:hypothetical protein
MNLEEMREKIAGLFIDFGKRIETLAEGLSDEDILTLSRDCASKDEAFWKIASEYLLMEIGVRVAFRNAQAYFEKTGASFYCLHCGGACTPEHIAEMG